MLRRVREQLDFGRVREQRAMAELVRLEDVDELVRLESIVRLEIPDFRLEEIVTLEGIVRLEDADELEGIVRLEGDEDELDGIVRLEAIVKLEGLDLDSLDGLSDDELDAIVRFEGFWSSLTKPFKKAAKVVGGVVKTATKGVVALGKVAAKVGKFVVETPTLRRILAAASVPFTGPAGPALFEIGASMAQQHLGKTKGKKAKQRLAQQAVAKGAPPSKDLPDHKYTKSEVARVMQRLAKAGPARVRIAQRIVRAGVPAPIAARIVLGDEATTPPQCPTPKEVQRMAALASIAVQAATGELGGLARSTFRG